jgi:hypothetical protein
MARLFALLLVNLWVAPAVAATPSANPLGAASGRPTPVAARLLDEDPRLQKPVTLRLKRSPLAAVVAELDRQTGVPMRATSDVSDEPVFLFVTEQPAGEVMRHLATLLGYRWTRAGAGKEDGGGYEIYQDLRSKQDEEALRGKRHGRALAALRAALAERLRLAQYAPERLLQEVATVDRGSESSTRSYSLRELADPSRRALLQVAALLTPAQWQELASGGSVHFSTLPEPGAVPLPPVLARVLREAPPSALPPGVRPGFVTDEDKAGYALEEQRSQDAWKRARGFCVSARLGLASQGPVAEAVLSISSAAVMPAGEPAPVLLPSLTLVGRGDAAPEAREPSQSYRKDDALLGRERRLPPARTGEGSDPLIETLAAIAESFGINLVADAYRVEGSTASSLPSGEEETLYEALDQYVTPHAGWRREGAFFLARRHGWYHLRPREIPERVVTRWADALRRSGGFTLEDAARLAATLSDAQLAGFEGRLREASLLVDLGFDGEDEMARGRRAVLRAYASLLPVERRRLAAGGQIALAAMSPAAQKWLQRALVSGHTRKAGLPHEASAPGTLALAAMSEEGILTEVSFRVTTGAEEGSEFRIELPRVAAAPTR